MDIQVIINLVLGAVMAAMGWFAREMWSAVKELTSDIATLREEIPKQYALKDTLEKAVNDLKGGFERSTDKLDAKLDKIFDKLYSDK